MQTDARENLPAQSKTAYAVYYDIRKENILWTVNQDSPF